MTVWRVEVQDTDGQRHGLLLEGDDRSSTVDVASQLRSLGFRGRPITITGQRFSETQDLSAVTCVGDLRLSHGDIIRCGSDYAAAAECLAAARPGHALGRHLVVVTGPDAGTSFLLEPAFQLASGRFVLGRSSAADAALSDRLTSASHAVLQLGGDGSITAADLGSTNGTFLEGRPIGREPVQLKPGDYLQVGSSVLTVVVVESQELATLGEHFGANSAFPRRFRHATQSLPTKLKPPGHPATSEPSKSPWWRSLTPLITGIGFAMMTGRWQFLLIIALAPILFTIDIQKQKKRRLQEREAALAVYESEQAAFKKSVDDVRSAERDRLRTQAIGGGVGSFFATIRHRRLWERTAGDPDFGAVDLGLAALRSTIDAGDDSTLTGRPRLWGMPLSASLPETGSLGVTGPMDRCRAVLRNLVIGTAATHSPVDVRFWFFTDAEHEAEWDFARWLPHSFTSERTSAIGSTGPERAALLKALRQLVDTRGQEQRDGQIGPLHIVVVDGTHLMPNRELAELLTDGPPVGVVGIVADSVSVPEGVNGQLTLGTDADTARFESTLEPLVEDVLTAELSGDRADRAARSLAGLRPAGSDHAPATEREVQLVDLLGIDGADGSDLAERWNQMSPSTEALVGVAGEAPMTIDIARHGPHGLVGGMSGSGKTEFLMTLLTSLCLNNHPDDLSIVIVDFKGGVDHALTSQLPHVVGMSTNLQSEQFKRTIDLLDAEQRRRQRLFQGVGGDLDAYRQARVSRPSLPPIPRLLVIVDEFSELLASDEGKDRLKELVRVTRIGRALGVHLLLVTQNFEGQLPPQVEANAGLRVCLRVMKASHSKVVLDSGVASTIPDRKVGRAFARFHGGDLTEFQTARVAGRRDDLSSGPPPVVATLVSLSRLSRGQAPSQPEKAPTEETDMFALVEQLWAAARMTGWTHSAVPWPSELSTVVPLYKLLRTRTPSGCEPQSFPVGLQDRPDQQEQTVLSLADTDGHVLFLGAGAAGVTDVLVAVATSAAVLHHPDDLHIHGIDLDGSGLARLADFPHCGTVATRDEILAGRLLKHLGKIVAERRSNLVAHGARSVSDLAAPDRPVQLLLIVTGADRLVRRGDDTRSQLLPPLISLIAESIGTGVQIFLGGLPSVADSRLAVNIDRRFVMSLPGDINPSAYGVPRELAPTLGLPGRAVDTTSKRLTQFACLSDGDRTEGQVASEVANRLNELHPLVKSAPPSLASVAWPVPAPRELTPPSGYDQPLPIGIDTESGAMSWIDAVEDGPVVVVTGPSESGRSTALLMIAELARRLGWYALGVPGSQRSPVASSDQLDALIQANEFGDALTYVDRSQPVIVLLDDAQRLDANVLDFSGLAKRPHVVLVAGPAEFIDRRSELAKLLPAFGAGLLLCPKSALDGAAVGISGRLPDEVRTNPRPGRGLLAIAGEYREVQVPLP